MNIPLLFVLACATILVQIIDSKKYRGIMSDELLDYELDKSVASYKEYFSLDHLILEQTEDDNVFIGGYVECVKSFDKNLPIKQDVRTQFYKNSKWNEGQVRLVNPDLCSEFVKSDRYIYTFTKLWTSDLCPPQKGDKWYIENQTLSAEINAPTFESDAPWRGYTKLSQGMPGMEKNILGVGFQIEFVLV